MFLFQSIVLDALTLAGIAISILTIWGMCHFCDR